MRREFEQCPDGSSFPEMIGRLVRMTTTEDLEESNVEIPCLRTDQLVVIVNTDARSSHCHHCIVHSRSIRLHFSLVFVELLKQQSRKPLVLRQSTLVLSQDTRVSRNDAMHSWSIELRVVVVSLQAHQTYDMIWRKKVFLSGSRRQLLLRWQGSRSTILLTFPMSFEGSLVTGADLQRFPITTKTNGFSSLRINQQAHTTLITSASYAAIKRPQRMVWLTEEDWLILTLSANQRVQDWLADRSSVLCLSLKGMAWLSQTHTSRLMGRRLFHCPTSQTQSKHGRPDNVLKWALECDCLVQPSIYSCRIDPSLWFAREWDSSLPI